MKVYVRNTFSNLLVPSPRAVPGAPYQWPDRDFAEAWISEQLHPEHFAVEEQE